MAEEWFGRSDHPLLNNVILSNVFEYARPRDLKECRVVSKKWNVSTIPFTRKKWKVLRIYGNINPPKRSTGSFRVDRKIGKFVKLFSLNKLGIPFARLQLGAFRMTNVIGQQLLQLCGDIAQEIDLTLIGSQAFMVEDVSELLRSTPNLVKFHISNLQSRSSNTVKLFPGPDDSKPKLSFLKKLKLAGICGRMKFCPTFLEELFLAAENILYISIDHPVMDESNGSLIKNGTLEVLNIIEKLKRESSIESLHFVELKEEYVEILRRMKSNGMKLKRIKLSDNFSRVPVGGIIFQVATIFSDTLEHFGMSRCQRKESSMKFPKMSQLTCLKIRDFTKFVFRFESFSEVFPALEKLDIDRFESDNEFDAFLSDSDPCPKMKVFKLSCCTMKITGFNRTLTLFPKLTELHLNEIRTDVFVLRSIWSEMTQLEVLSLNGLIQTRNNLDSIFTGISADSLDEIDHLVNELDEMTADVRRETILRLRNQHSLLPSIVNLTNLRRLQLSVTSGVDDEEEEERGYLTDMTGFLGFYAMPELRGLEVNRCKLTETCCELLTTDTGMELSGRP